MGIFTNIGRSHALKITDGYVVIWIEWMLLIPVRMTLDDRQEI